MMIETTYILINNCKLHYFVLEFRYARDLINMLNLMDHYKNKANMNKTCIKNVVKLGNDTQVECLDVVEVLSEETKRYL